MNAQTMVEDQRDGREHRIRQPAYGTLPVRSIRTLSWLDATELRTAPQTRFVDTKGEGLTT